MPEFDRRRLLKLSGSAITATVGVTGLSGSAAATHVGVDDPVVSTVDLNVRDGPGTDYDVIADADQWTGGEIVDGPTESDGYTWWKVQWNEDDDNGDVTGWSAEGDAWIDGPTDFSYPCWGRITQEHKSDHEALDIGNDTGTPIGAARDGTVSATGYGDRCGYFVKLDHGDGWQTIYCHLSTIDATEGETVVRDEKIGEMGSTGNSTGPHLHWSIDQYGDRKWIPGTKGYDVVGGAGVPNDYGI